MLSYRHGFHAGNFADVLKHLVLFYTLNYYNNKDKPYWYIDTHAGAGLYNIQDNFALKTGEYADGMAKLQNSELTSPLLKTFTSFINDFQNKAPYLYPGSPLIAKSLLRKSDKIKLFELHPTDYEHLKNNFKGSRIPYQIENSDGFKGLIGLLPPSSRRSVVLIDPPYENKSDYDTVIKTLTAAVKRFPSGCYILWYPLLLRQESHNLPSALATHFPINSLNVSLVTHSIKESTYGMYGTGLFIINPPYSLGSDLKSALPELTSLLALDDTAEFDIVENLL